jgi:DNA-binding NtrC family response regulator
MPVKVDFRAIAATNKRLESLVEERTFRPDLYYRLNVFAIDIPPLRERAEDIPLLAEHFMKKLSAQMNRPQQRLASSAIDLMMAYPWPGNVRELENAIERAMLINRAAELTAADFPFQTRRGAPAQEITGGQRLEDIERVHIERVLEETHWNLSRTARILDIDRTTLYNKIKRFGLRETQAN